MAQVLELDQHCSCERQREESLVCLIFNHVDDALEAIALTKDVCEGHAEAIFFDFVFPREISLFDILRLERHEEGASAGA